MTVPDKLPNGAKNGLEGSRPVVAPALARLLADSALSRAALAACGFPVALADASAKGRPLTYVNPSFEAFFGYRADEARGALKEVGKTIAAEASVHEKLAGALKYLGPSLKTS